MEEVKINKDFLLWALDINDILTTTLTSQIIIVALGLAAIFFAINMAYNYLSTGYKKFTGDGSEAFPNYNEIARCIIIIICISTYLPIAKVIVGTMEAANKATSIEYVEYSDAYANLEKANQIVSPSDANITEDGNVEFNANDNNDTGKIEESSSESKMASGISSLVSMLNPANMAAMAIHSIVALLVTIIQFIIMGVAVIITKILVIVGPLAFAFSILPPLRNQIDSWFSTLLTTGMSFTTINILNGIMNAATNTLFSSGSDITTAGEIVALDCIMIILYCSVFWLTSKYVGKGDAGRVISKLIATTTAIAAMTMSKEAVPGSSTITGATNTAKSVIDEGGE